MYTISMCRLSKIKQKNNACVSGDYILYCPGGRIVTELQNYFGNYKK